MKVIKVSVAALASLMLITGCATMSNTGKGAAIGAGGGAALGAGIGALAGGGKGAAIGSAVGAAVGAGTGALVGKRMDKQKAELEQIPGVQVETVTDVNDLQAIKLTFDNKILFATNQTTLSQSATSSLSQFAQSLSENPGTDITINGHTDNTGTRDVNQRISTERAQAVANYLKGHGVSGSRMTVQGLAFDVPVADNSTEEGRAQNRRVEIFITANADMIRQAEAGTLK